MSVPSSDWFAVFCDVLVFVWLSASMMLGSFCVASIGAWIVVESFHNIQTFMKKLLYPSATPKPKTKDKTVRN